MFWERRNYFYSLIDFSPPICKVFHLTWCAPLGWKPLCWSENCCWASPAGCRRNFISVWEMALESSRAWELLGGEWSWRSSLCPLSLCFCLWACLKGTVSPGWEGTPWQSTLPPHHPEREHTGKGGVPCSCKQRHKEVRCNLHYKSGWFSFKDKGVESMKQGRSKCWYLDVDCNCEKGLALRQIQN